MAKSRKKPAPAPTATEAQLAKMAGAAPKDEKQGKFDGVVARGRSVDDGKKVYMPGETFHGSKEEISKLRRSGHLVDPSAPSRLIGSGPTFIAGDPAVANAEPG